MKLEELEAIVEKAPSGATHVSHNGVYYKQMYSEPQTYVWWIRGEEWIDTPINHLCRSLEDIRKIICLTKES